MVVKDSLRAATREGGTWYVVPTLALVLCLLNREKALDADLDFTAASESMDWFGITYKWRYEPFN